MEKREVFGELYKSCLFGGSSFSGVGWKQPGAGRLTLSGAHGEPGVWLNAVSMVPAPRTPGLLDCSGLLRALLSWLVVWTSLGKPRTAQMDCKQGNEALERCLVVV